MKSRIEQLEEKLLNIQNLIGEVSFSETNRKVNLSSSIFKENLNNITDVIHKLQKEISENDSIALKEVHRKFEELSPLLKIEKLNSEYNVSEKEMYLLIMSNFDELKSFLGNIVFVKENSKLLDYDPIVEVEEKTNLIRPLDLKTLNHETKLTQISESIDELVKNYTTSVQHINEKFAFYSQIISQLENS